LESSDEILDRLHGMSSRPNFLLFITDQQRADHVGCYGNDVLRTPHIDSLAARGTRFDRFYVATGICMPNRATLMTGRMPSVHGVRHNGIPLSRQSTTFVELLRAFGYATALIGKAHLQNIGDSGKNVRTWTNINDGEEPPAELKQAVKDHRSGRDYDNEWTPNWRGDPSYALQLPFYGFNYVDLCTYHGDQVGGDYENFLKKNYSDPDSLRGKDNARNDNRITAPQAWHTSIPEEHYPTNYIADRTIAWLENHARAGEKQPFFLQCSFPDPHHPWTPPGRYWDMYAPEDMPLPRSFHQTHLPALARAVHEHTRNGGNRFGMQPFAVNERECREILALNYGLVTMIDDAIGRVLEALKASGLDDNTVVIFTSDHGDFMGDRGMMLKGPAHYQGIIRVPFIWSDSKSPRPRASGNLAGTLDIAQTVLDRAHIAPYHGIQGRSLVPDARGDTSVEVPGMLVEQEATVFAFARPGPFRVRTLVTKRWRLSFSDDPGVCELYDLQNDPDEMQDRWNDPGCAPVRAQLLELLATEMIRHQDESPLPTAQA
jgi:arylsulfatase A-like enzyme